MSRKTSGLNAWLIQRVSAVYLILYSLLMLSQLLLSPPESHAQWVSWMALPWVNVATGLFALALLLHAWVGGRDIIMDYVQPLAIRFLLLSLFAMGLLACALWLASILLLIG